MCVDVCIRAVFSQKRKLAPFRIIDRSTRSATLSHNTVSDRKSWIAFVLGRIVPRCFVDHLMARKGFSTHPLEESVQGLDHSQLAAMYSRGEVKPSLSTAVSACHGKQRWRLREPTLL